MPSSCVSCSQSTSNPFNFLLNCVQCRLSWHHRCHKPPVSDNELIGIIRLFNLEKQKGNRDAKLVWKCGACIKGKAKAAEPEKNAGKPTSHPSEKILASRSQQAISSKLTHPAQKDLIIIDDDDDDIVVMDQPTVHPPGVNRQGEQAVTPKALNTHSVALVLESERQSSPPSRLPATLTHAVEGRKRLATKSRTVSSNSPSEARPEAQQGALFPPAIPPTTSLAKAIHQAKKTSSAKLYDTGIPIVDPFTDPEQMPAPLMPRPPLIQKQISSSSSGALVSGFIDLSMSMDEDSTMDDDDRDKRNDDDDDPLEYLTPPQPPAALLPPPEPPYVHAHNQQSVMPIGESSQSMITLYLLPAWINARRTALGEKPDFWQRAAHRVQTHKRPNQPPAQPTAASVIDAGGPPTVPVSSRRKLFTPLCLSRSSGKEPEKTVAQTPFFFDANLWMKRKMVAFPG